MGKFDFPSNFDGANESRVLIIVLAKLHCANETEAQCGRAGPPGQCPVLYRGQR